MRIIPVNRIMNEDDIVIVIRHNVGWREFMRISDTAPSARQNAIKGDICPRGSPLISPVIWKPRCSVTGMMFNKWDIINVIETIMIARNTNVIMFLIFFLGSLEGSKKIAAPNISIKRAVLGAIGILSDPNEANEVLPKVQPNRLKSPKPAVIRPHRRDIKLW